MIYLAVFNESVLPASRSPLGVKGKVGRRRQERGSREDHGDQEERPRLLLRTSCTAPFSFRRMRIFCPQIHACVKRRLH